MQSVAALDPTTSIALGALGVTANCFNAPLDRLRYKGTAAQKQVAKDGYKWGSHHWHMTTWNKVGRVMWRDQYTLHASVPGAVHGPQLDTFWSGMSHLAVHVLVR